MEFAFASSKKLVSAAQNVAVKSDRPRVNWNGRSPVISSGTPREARRGRCELLIPEQQV
jgi:hypothetical protein